MELRCRCKINKNEKKYETTGEHAKIKLHILIKISLHAYIGH